MKIKKVVDSFNHAIDGIIYAFRTQRNIKIHFLSALVILVACLFYDLSKTEILILFLTITLVIFAELINTALEAAVDATTNYYHPLIKIAKNVAAGAVLITALNAVMVGYIIFFDKITEITFDVMIKIKSSNPFVILITLAIVMLATVILKSIMGEGTHLRGGMPSGHSAIGFSIATSISLITEEPIVIALSYLLAFIVAQSRVDSNIHTAKEVLVGAVFGICITIIIFKFI